MTEIVMMMLVWGRYFEEKNSEECVCENINKIKSLMRNINFWVVSGHYGVRDPKNGSFLPRFKCFSRFQKRTKEAKQKVSWALHWSRFWSIKDFRIRKQQRLLILLVLSYPCLVFFNHFALFALQKSK